MKIIKGHTGGNKTQVIDITSQSNLDEYAGAGEFLGFGEVGKNSTISNWTNFINSIKSIFE